MLLSSGNTAKQFVAKQKCWNPDETQISQCKEHVQLKEVARIQAKDSCKTNVEANRTKRERKVGNIDSNFQPQCKQN